MNYRFLLFLLVFCSVSVCAQHPYAWHLTDKSGLPSLEVYDLFQDTKGYMWIGTDKGLCKYNGQNFYYYKNKAQKSRRLSDMQEGPNGRIWTRNLKGQLFYVANDSLHYFKEIETINPTSVSTFRVDTKGNLWLGEASENRIHSYDFEIKEWNTWTFERKDSLMSTSYKGVYDIEEVGAEEYLISTVYGLFKIKNNVLSFLTRKNLLVNQSEERTKVLETKLCKANNKVYMEQHFKEMYGLMLLEGDEVRSIQQKDWQKYLRKKEPNTLRILSDNNVWQLTLNGGVRPILNLKSSVDTNLVLFPNEGVSDILIDFEGNYWVSSFENGVFVIPKLGLMHYTYKNSIFEQDVFGIIRNVAKDTLLLSTDQGQVLVYNTTLNKVEHSYETPKKTCTQIELFDDQLMVNGQGFQMIYDVKESNYSHYSIEGNNYKHSSIYRDSIVLNAMGHTGVSLSMIGRDEVLGVSKFAKEVFPYFKEVTRGHIGQTLQQANSFKDVFPGIQNLDRNWNLNFYSKLLNKGKNCLWTFADEEGYRFLVGWNDSLICYPEVGTPFPILDEEGKAIQALHVIKSKLETGLYWVNTVDNGIIGLDRKLKVKYHYLEEHGLLNNYVQKIVATNEGLWMLTTYGIQFWNPTSNKVRIYTKQDGLPTDEITDLAIVGEKVWLSTIEGLVSFDANMISDNKTPPPVFLKSISINEKDTLMASHYNLSHRQNTVLIKVEGISYRSQGAFRYKYRMLGLDTIWREQSSRVDFMRFFQLNPGDYVFEVKTINEDGISSENGAMIRFNIATPYWQTYWFQGLMYFLGTLVVVGIVLLRTRAKRRIEGQNNSINELKMRALQSQMNPHFIFNVLTAVQNLWLQNKNEAAMELQSSFAKLLRKIFQYSGELGISIEQLEDFLNNYLSLEQIRFENEVQIDFDIEEHLLDENYFVPPLLLQPIIENSFKHGLFHKKDDKNLKIKLKKEGLYLYCLIEDDGVGRKDKGEERLNRPSGLSTTRKRLTIMQESIIKTAHPLNNFKITDLLSEENERLGTRVEIWIPFVKT